MAIFGGLRLRRQGPGAKVTIEGTSALIKKLNHIGTRGAENAQRAAMRDVMKFIQWIARAGAPVDTGALKRHIDIRVASGWTIVGRVGTFASVKDLTTGKVPDEYGWVREKRASFLNEPFREHRGQIMRTFFIRLNEQIAKRW